MPGYRLTLTAPIEECPTVQALVTEGLHLIHLYRLDYEVVDSTEEQRRALYDLRGEEVEDVMLMRHPPRPI